MDHVDGETDRFLKVKTKKRLSLGHWSGLFVSFTCNNLSTTTMVDATCTYQFDLNLVFLTPNINIFIKILHKYELVFL